MSLFEVYERSSAPKDEKSIQAVWVSILFPTGDTDFYRIEKLFTILRTYSLVRFHADTNSYSMHRMIHAWSTDRIGTAEREKYQLASMSLLKYSLYNEKRQSPSMRTRLIPHLIGNFSQGSTTVYDKVKDESVMEGFLVMARFIDSAGQWKETLVIENFLLEKVRNWCGTKHTATINAMSMSVRCR